MKEHFFHDQPTLPTATAAVKQDIPKRVGPYLIESLLARGGMSSLYLGKEAQSGRVVVLKVLSPSFVENQNMVKQFLEEAKIISIADHPNIIKLYGQGKWQHGLYIAMEFVQGVSLRQFIYQHSLSLKRCLDIAMQVAYALLHLHTHDIIHRDLKPENILITESGQVKVIDFGVAQLRSASKIPSYPGGTIGTLSYMAPEQAEDPMKATYASDIYALGVITYEMIIGKLSFGNIQLSYVPKHIRPILTKALATSLKERYQDVVDFITAVSEYTKKHLMRDEMTEGMSHSEILDTLLEAQKSFTTFSTPQWDHLDIGVALPKHFQPIGLYHDFVRFSPHCFLVVIAEALSIEIDAALYIAYLKGLMKPLISKHAQTKSFDMDSLTSDLNDLITQDAHASKFKLNLLFLNLEDDYYTFLSCGYHSLWHDSPDTAHPKLITLDNPYLGEKKSPDFKHMKDNWYPQDRLMIHTFNDMALSPEEQMHIENAARSIIEKQINLSTPSLSTALLDGLSAQIHPSLAKEKRSVIVIERL